MSLNDPSLDGRTDPRFDSTGGPSIGGRAGTAPMPPTADAGGQRSRAAIRTENRLLRARAAALERELTNSREERRRVIERYEALLSDRRVGDTSGEHATGESAAGSASRPSNVLIAVRDWFARR